MNTVIDNQILEDYFLHRIKSEYQHLPQVSLFSPFNYSKAVNCSPIPIRRPVLALVVLSLLASYQPSNVPLLSLICFYPH